ncbi:MAG: hypothetical protein HFE73_08115 [Firmicutes bacterium]|nr:hypothetical protein [Bacillota bacterium]
MFDAVWMNLEEAAMERNYPLFWIFLASLYATLLNLLGMCQEVNTVYTLTITAVVYVLWGSSIYLLFRQSKHMGKTCIRLSLFVMFLMLLFLASEWWNAESGYISMFEELGLETVSLESGY